MESETTLKQWVQEHRVAWETARWHEMVGREATAVGFELRLFGQHKTPAHPNPGCRECVALHSRLSAIVKSVLPQDRRVTEFEIEPFDASFHLRPESDWVAEVELTVHIVHREDHLRPVDECQRRCTEVIQKGLAALGVRPRAWSRATPSLSGVRGS